MRRHIPAALTGLIAILLLPSLCLGGVPHGFGKTARLNDETPAAPADRTGLRSGKAAFFMSLLLPGAGELYSGAKVRAAGFAAAEVLTWVAWLHWRGKGADLRSEFRAFADANWEESRYQAWRDYNRRQTPSYNETHELPSKTTDTQQYYELIGKYNQFVFGWTDVTAPHTSVDAEIRQIQSPARASYESQRNESNRYLKRASVVIGITVVNHVASAIHASACARTTHPPVERRLWVDLAPLGPSGGPGASALLTARF